MPALFLGRTGRKGSSGAKPPAPALLPAPTACGAGARGSPESQLLQETDCAPSTCKRVSLTEERRAQAWWRGAGDGGAGEGELPPLPPEHAAPAAPGLWHRGRRRKRRKTRRDLPKWASGHSRCFLCGLFEGGPCFLLQGLNIWTRSEGVPGWLFPGRRMGTRHKTLLRWPKSRAERREGGVFSVSTPLTEGLPGSKPTAAQVGKGSSGAVECGG